MNNFKFYVLSILVIGCLYGCETQFHDFRPEWQTGLFSFGENTHIDELIDIDGYYVSVNYSDSSHLQPLVFYNDGSFGNLEFINKADAKNRTRNIDMCNDSIIFRFEYASYDYCTGGHYAIDKDTIILDKYYETVHMLFGLSKLKFLIVDRQHIRLIQRQYLSVRHNEVIVFNENELYEYVPTSNKLPTTGIGAKLEKKLWKDKKEYKIWNRMHQKILRSKLEK